MDFSTQDLITLVPQGDRRALARLITLVENGVPRGREVLEAIFPKSGRAHVVGVTGSPGAGKSTLVDQLAVESRQRGEKVAIIAIDPTSPFSGGAVLGDRIRMNKVAEDETIFLRSMATRGALGGVARATLDVVYLLDAAGFNKIFIETVGVGQAEIDIVRLADTCLVVLVPGMGDSVQAFKAGILEIADSFIINKADREGALPLERDLRVLLSLAQPDPADWIPEIQKSVATTGEGTKEIVDLISSHHKWLSESVLGLKRKRRIVEESIERIASDILRSRVQAVDPGIRSDLIERCLKRELDPFRAAQLLIDAGTK